MALVRKKLSDARAHSREVDSAVVFARLEEVGLLTVPVDVHAIAEYLGVEVVEEVMDDEISGYIEPRKAGWVIGINAFHNSLRQRFTVAHELGHFVLHRPGERITDITFARRMGQRDPIEVEADGFAANLLMPETAFRRLIQDGERSLEKVASHFKVSLLAARVRAQSLGYGVQ